MNGLVSAQTRIASANESLPEHTTNSTVDWKNRTWMHDAATIENLMNFRNNLQFSSKSEIFEIFEKSLEVEL